MAPRETYYAGERLEPETARALQEATLRAFFAGAPVRVAFEDGIAVASLQEAP